MPRSFRFLGVEFEEQGDAIGVGCGRLKAVYLINKRMVLLRHLKDFLVIFQTSAKEIIRRDTAPCA